MTDDPRPGFRAELLAALDVVNPQIEGLDTLSQAGLSAEVTAILQNTMTARLNRRDLILAVIAALDTVLEKFGLLVDDGYPAFSGLTVSEVLTDELQKEKDAIEAAIAIFKAESLASKIQLDLTVANRKDT